jgi:hypothetical protein
MNKSNRNLPLAFAVAAAWLWHLGGNAQQESGLEK